MPIPKNINQEHIIQAIQKISKEGVPEKRGSTRFSILYEGKHYPPKYVISIANIFANGEELSSSKFSGGEETNKFLSKLGFNIVETTINKAETRFEYSEMNKEVNPHAIIQRKADESLFEVFDKELYDTSRMIQKEFEKEKHKEAWNQWRDIIKKVIEEVAYDFDVIPHRWIIGQRLLQYFWFEIKHKDRRNSASSISFSVNQEQLKVYLEWNRQQSERSVNNLEEHNQWINFITSWVNGYHIDLNKFSFWVVNNNPEPITLNQFINDSRMARLKIQQQQHNDIFSFRVGVIISREDFLRLNNYESKLMEWFIQLKGIYPHTTRNLYNGELGKAVYGDIEAELLEENLHRFEGKVKHYFGKRYERDPINRKHAIEIHGLSCKVCGFNFEKVYGERGKDFIEVHHVKALSSLVEEMLIDPRKDLVPICANCHRMIHRRKDDVLTIEELTTLLKDKNTD
ncbi:HNH endonuclease [Domibacillus indicus]|uniref:HI_0552 family protein n=1 Tax=Domibacillus indicus TaxID=1437523 RepID=UPI00203F0EC3|nr:HI_0552 family protein [Domibacillus indicus]MCM3790338.1 HNH endonuclease [Domibacillus indicus]